MSEDLANVFAATGALWRGNRLHQVITRPHADAALALVRASGVCDLLRQWRAEDRHVEGRGGRPALFSDETALVVMLLAAQEDQPLLVTVFRDIVACRLSRNAAASLDIPADRRQRTRACYDPLWAAIQRVLAVLDPFWGEPRRRITKEAFARNVQARDPRVVARRKDRIRTFCNALVWASVEATPDRFRSRWAGTVGIDATPIPLDKAGTSDGSTRVSINPDAGWYRRSHETGDPERGKRDSVMWAYDMTMTVMAHPGPGGDFPKLVCGISLDKPAVDPAGNGRIAMANLLTHDVPRNFLVGDRAYMPGPKPETWQVPMRKAGYKLIGDQISGQEGRKAAHGGALLIDGQWCCPGMPEPLQELLPLTRKDMATIPDEQRPSAEILLAKQLDNRTHYLLKQKEAPRPNGSVVMRCPALGPGASVECPLRPVQPRTRKGVRTQVLNPPSPRPKVCTQTSITIPVEVGAKYAQQGPPYLSAAWRDIYVHPRQTIESKNNSLKNGRHHAARLIYRRQVRGFAACYLFMALLVVAENLRLIDAAITAETSPVPAPEPAPPGLPDGLPDSPASVWVVDPDQLLPLLQ